MSLKSKYKRVLIKLSGEGLMGDQDYGFDKQTLLQIVDEIRSVHAAGVQICIVIGGGNIFRGFRDSEELGIEPSDGHYMGMLATIINTLALRDIFEKQGIPARAFSSIPMPTVCEQYIRQRARRHMEKGYIVISGGGTGLPFVSTDTCAALRAAELNCDIILKATQVDGVYDKDPQKHKDATRYDRITYQDILEKRLDVMDQAGIAIARENHIPVAVFNLRQPHILQDVLSGQENCCTLIHEE